MADGMDARVEQLFHEVADLSAAARAQHFADHGVDEGLRREVEALLAFDAGSTEFLSRDVATAAAAALPLVESKGRQCGPYRLLDIIGRGGMGEVYRAERVDGEVDQSVAVKLLPPGVGAAYRERFLQERQILASLAHPNIARMLDAGHLDNGQPFLAMEFVDGKPLDVFAAGLGVRQKVVLFLKVCAAVAYLHRNLVVHRDLKPSNILVTADGEPKLLDFGIAKMLDAATDVTRTGLRMLTPDYASPEQVMGGTVTIATDIYSLGAVLYQLLSGKPAHEFQTHSAEGIARVVASGPIAHPSKWVPELKGDLESILLRALRKDPRERYATVNQFADDLEAFLQSLPVKARSGNTWYRARKFLRRHWAPATAAALVVLSLSAGLYVANRQRALAQQRFVEVRRLANKVLALGDTMKGLPGSTKAREEIVAMSQEYLAALAPQAGADQDLALEIAGGYLKLAEAQGGPTTANLGHFAQADASLKKSEAILDPIVTASPRNRRALLLSAGVSELRMILADLDNRDEEALAQARKAAARIDALLALGTISTAEQKAIARDLNNMAQTYQNERRLDEAIRAARRSIEIARSLPPGEENSADSYALIADCLRLSGDLEGALEAIREARAILEKSPMTNDVGRRSKSDNILQTEGAILGKDGGISLNRPAEAAATLQKAFDLGEEWAGKDANDAASRMRLGEAARELGKILTHTDPQKALAVFDTAIRRLREVQGNNFARREEATLQAAASYPLRALKRVPEAQQRIDLALALLRQTKDYPADQVGPGGEADLVLRAEADLFADANDPKRAGAVYQELLDKIMAGKPDIENDLEIAAQMSRLYDSLAALDRRNGESQKAAELDALRHKLWQGWDRKIPNNPFVLSQLKAGS